MTTYRHADGRLVGNEFTFVGELEVFDDEKQESDYFEIVEEHWVLARRNVLKLGRTSRWCEECDEDIDLEEPVDGPVYCDAHQPKVDG